MFGQPWTPFRDYSRQTFTTLTNEHRKSFMEQQKWLTEKIYPAIAERNAMSKKKVHALKNAKRKQLGPLKIGAKVYALDPIREAKADVIYEGPYEVVGIDDYVLKDGDGKLLGRHFSVDQLKVVQGKIEFGETFVVEKILDHREGSDGYEYLVKWRGYGDEENSWEPQKNFQDWKVIQKYWKSRAITTGVLNKAS